MNSRLRIAGAILYIGLIGTVVAVHAAAGVQKPPFTQVAARPTTLTDSTLTAADRTVTKGTVSSDKKTLSFSQKKTVRLVVHTGPESDMLSFRVNGLRNPTISIRHGVALRVLFVNNDGDMFHNIRFGAKPRAFENTADSLLKTSVGTAPLAHVDGRTIHGTEMIIKVPNHAGKYAYFCTVRGHANGGMWGTIQIR